MPIQIQQVPYEFLARWKDDGTFSGAHVIFQEIKSFEGEVLSRTFSEALTPEAASALGFPFPDVLSQLLTDTLVENGQLKADKADLERAMASQAESHAAELAASQANTQALLAEIEALKAASAA